MRNPSSVSTNVNQSYKDETLTLPNEILNGRSYIENGWLLNLLTYFLHKIMVGDRLEH